MPLTANTVADLSCPCERRYLRARLQYNAPPSGEVRFAATAAAYDRTFARCDLCGHWFDQHQIDLGKLYSGDYVSSTYRDGLRPAFDRIVALPPERSDNAGRVAGVLDFAASRWGLAAGHPRRVLDIGSGLCVFLHRMKAAGWEPTALDPDERAVRHAREVVGVRAVCRDFRDAENLGEFDLIAFNKVLEHVPAPVPLLARARRFLSSDGFVYVEVPDGEAASAEGRDREEFFIDHWHAFSPASIAFLGERAGFAVERVERLREPSGKFTLRAFMGHPA